MKPTNPSYVDHMITCDTSVNMSFGVILETTGWTRDEVAKMLLYARGTQDRALILVLASSGMRAGMVTRASHMVMSKHVRQMVDGAGLHQEKNGKRFHVPLVNGLRRFFNKSCKGSASGDSAISSLIKKEFMMGHRGLTSLDENYFKTDVLELAAEYVTAVPSLTIDDADRLRQSNRTMKTNIQRLEDEKDEELARFTRCMQEMRHERNQMRQEIFEMKKQKEMSAMDFLDILKRQSSSDGMSEELLTSLTGIMQQLAEAQRRAMEDLKRSYETRSLTKILIKFIYHPAP